MRMACYGPRISAQVGLLRICLDALGIDKGCAPARHARTCNDGRDICPRHRRLKAIHCPRTFLPPAQPPALPFCSTPALAATPPPRAACTEQYADRPFVFVCHLAWAVHWQGGRESLDPRDGHVSRLRPGLRIPRPQTANARPQITDGRP